jgi:hypothetical protein
MKVYETRVFIEGDYKPDVRDVLVHWVTAGAFTKPAPAFVRLKVETGAIGLHWADGNGNSAQVTLTVAELAELINERAGRD